MSAASASQRAAVVLRDRVGPVAQRAWPWVPVALGVLYAILLATQLRSIVQAIYWNADAGSALTIGELYPDRAPGSVVVLGNFPWYSTLWFEEATRHLPHHRQIWQVGPWLFSLGGIALVAWSTARAAGRWAGTMTALALACAGPALLTLQFSASVHAFTYFSVCVLAFYVVLLVAQGGLVGPWPAHVGLAAVITVVTAGNVASDPSLLGTGGVAPFFLAGVGVALVLPRAAALRVAGTVTAVSGLSLIGAKVLGSIMRDKGVNAHKFEVSFAPWERLGPNLRLGGQSLTNLFTGDFGGMKLGALAFLTFACGAAILIGLVAAVRHLRGWTERGIEAVRLRSASTLGQRPALTAHVAFWGLAGVILGVSFLLSSTPVDRASGRYIVTVAYAIAAIVPAAAVARGTWARGAVVIGLSVILIGSCAALIRHDVRDQAQGLPNPSLSGPLVRFAQDQGVKYGYSGYWDAAPITWQAKGDLDVFPVRSCAGERSKVCPFYLHYISSWYAQRPNTKTMLISDPRLPDGAMSPEGFGRPEQVRVIGPATVYVYPYDISTRFSP